jgi:hypothetical protein
MGNIFHVFVWEVEALIQASQGDADCGIVLRNYDESSICAWRIEVVRSLFKDVYLGETPSFINSNDVYELPGALTPMFDPFSFSKIDPSPLHIALANRIKARYGSNTPKQNKVVFVERKTDRVLYDYKSKRPLRDALQERVEPLGIELVIANFDRATFDYQARTLADAKIMLSCHGAANTNLFLLPQEAALLEVNFRKYWYCDPVCAKHQSGELPYRTDCGGPLTYRSTFHKADYHNLSQVFGVRYKELEIEDAEKFTSSNPIGLEKIFVNADNVAHNIREIIGS